MDSCECYFYRFFVAITSIRICHVFHFMKDHTWPWASFSNCNYKTANNKGAWSESLKHSRLFYLKNNMFFLRQHLMGKKQRRESLLHKIEKNLSELLDLYLSRVPIVWIAYLEYKIMFIKINVCLGYGFSCCEEIPWPVQFLLENISFRLAYISEV